MRRLLPWALVPVLVSSACATTSTLEIPSCADKVQIDGEHVRDRRTLTFDHALDPPWSMTRIVLQSDEGEEVVTLWNNQPDGARLLLGVALGGLCVVLVGSAAYQTALAGGDVVDEGAFYGFLVGGVAGVLGSVLALTGWHPSETWDLEQWCQAGP